MKIHQLPEEIVKRIAAGEVVERPASVVKELIENAVDAGAKHVDLEVKGAGRLLIRVSDDGCGMGKDDLTRSVQRHTTSKIHSIADIDEIMTLGFRGEALYSIAAISKMEITSRTGEDPMGYCLQVEGGKVGRLEGVGSPIGTTVVVRDLFWNTPARLKFLKSSTTEMHHVFDVVAAQASARPDVAFKLRDGEKAWIDLPASQGLSERVQGLYPALGRDWISVDYKSDAVQVLGCIGHPSMARGDRSNQFFFVNRRPVKSPSLGYAVEAAFHSLLPEGKHPVFFILIEILPENVDVNIHPSKKEVRFHKIQEVQDGLREAVRRSLSLHYSRGEETPLKGEGSHYPEPRIQASVIRDTVRALDFLRPRAKGHSQSPKVFETSNISQSNMAHAKDGIHPLGCYDDLYWVFRLEDGLALMDQHAAHERVLYEKYLQDWRERKIEVQALLIAEHVELTREDYALFEEHQATFKNLGFGVQAFGDTSVMISQVPHYCETHRLKELLMDILDDLKTFRKTTSTNEEQLEEKIILRACKSAVKAHDVMTHEEARKLMRDLLSCELPYTCPHGRPTLVKFTASDLAKMFHRK